MKKLMEEFEGKFGFSVSHTTRVNLTFYIITRVLFASDTNFSEEFEGNFGFSVLHTTRVNLLY